MWEKLLVVVLLLWPGTDWIWQIVNDPAGVGQSMCIVAFAFHLRISELPAKFRVVFAGYTSTTRKEMVIKPDRI
ncbi:hypothetical protein [Pontibacter liquoris]|uniref:hypothetical protein n=1 Tax=Pontibacter liquoris TaxID=2905677 RepID=UPI001FA7744B|nr:hypothetical protein [Pontibacter liquoris]